jgi:hypothetical protein
VDDPVSVSRSKEERNKFQFVVNVNFSFRRKIDEELELGS